MAIQMRRGEYDDFDASKMLAGELAVVVSGDPETEGGALYVATAAGSATRVAFANEIPGDATTTSDGLMSAADKAKLDGVAAGAQANVIESVSVNGNNATVTGKAAAVTIPEATDAASGVMGAGDKAKLDGIAAGAKKVTITETTRGSGAQVVSFSVQNPDGTFEFPPTAVKADSNGYVDMTSVANGSIPNSKLATPYSLPTMSASAKGGATVGDGLAMTGDALGIADEGVEMGMLSQEVQEAIAEGGSGSGYNPSLSVGRADALTGADETAQWATRESTGSGAATVRSVQGAAVVWNQMAQNGDFANGTHWNKVSNIFNWTVADNMATLTANDSGYAIGLSSDVVALVDGHKYLVSCYAKTSNANALYVSLNSNSGTINGVAANVALSNAFQKVGGIVTYAPPSSGTNRVRIATSAASTASGDVLTIANAQLFDLTLMFGSGNEPTTVAEFEAMFPEAYYPYSAPTLKPVQIAGIKSVGFNQWDEEWEVGQYSTSTGEKEDNARRIRSKNYIPAKSSTTYCFTMDAGVANNAYVLFYDESKSFLSISYVQISTSTGLTFTTPSNCRYMTFFVWSSWAVTSYSGGICINISNPALNGQYKPYTTEAIEWTAQTLRAAGSVADMLYSDHVETRVGVVDLGTLTWAKNSESQFFATTPAQGQPFATNHICVPYETSAHGAYDGNVDKSITIAGTRAWIRDSAYNDAASFKTAMSGVMLFYALATPTTTPINPALPMTYRVEQGGTESIIVPAGEISAAPVLTVAEGESAGDVVMNALACIATPDGPVATSSHAVNTYLTMQGKLYKVTSAIAVGETIKSGTNVTETTVMAELIARTA